MKTIDYLVDSLFSPISKKYLYDTKRDEFGLAYLYKDNMQNIKDLYSQAYYWHGTGRYHYKHFGASKYHSRFVDEHVDILLSIINQSGLIPQYDFWTGLTSISLTKNRIYASAYSQFHQNSHDQLKYTFGPTKFWFYVLAIKQIFTNNFLHNIYKINHMHNDTNFKEKFRQWARYVKKDIHGEQINVFSFYKLRSDIPDNYGILIGIKKEAVNELNYNPTIERFESRCSTPITFDQMTHIEVPLKNLENTRKLLKKYNITLPILPLELTEIYCSQLGYKKFS